MRSLDGLSLEQLGRWRDVLPASYDPELGEGRCVAGAPPVYQPPMGDRPASSPAPRFLDLLTARRPEDLGPHVNSMVSGQPDVRGFPPTAPPAGISAARIPPAWAVSVTPDDELRTNSPVTGTY